MNLVDPKEQAIKIMEQMTQSAFMGGAGLKIFDKKYHSIAFRDARESAIVAVKNIISELEMLYKPEYAQFVFKNIKDMDNNIKVQDGYERLSFWNSVCEELENL